MKASEIIKKSSRQHPLLDYILSFAVPLIFALIIFISSVAVPLIKDMVFISDAKTVSAEVTDINSGHRSTGRITYLVYNTTFTYTVDDIQYNVIYGFTSFKIYSHGDKATIYYNPENPKEIIFPKHQIADNFFSMVLVIICILVALESRRHYIKTEAQFI